jgi:hypothetical protein
MRRPKHEASQTGTRVPVSIPSFLTELPPPPLEVIQSSREIAEYVTSLAWMSAQDHPAAEDAKRLLDDVYGGRFLTVEDAKRVRVLEGEFAPYPGSARAAQSVEIEPPVSREAVKKSLRRRAGPRVIA